MSLITALTATPSRVRTYLRTCEFLGGRVDRTELDLLLVPKSLRPSDNDDASAITREVTEECRSLGLITVAGQDVQLTDAGSEAAVDLATWIRPVLVRPELAAKTGQQDFPVLLAWLMMQDPYEFLDWAEAPSASIRQLLGSDVTAAGATLRNMSVYQQFLYWARFAGFVQLTKYERTMRVLPVPTDAVAWAIGEAGFRPGTSTPADVVLAALGTACPVLDGGSVRVDLERRSETPTYAPGISVSATLGLALLTLEAASRIALDTIADAPVNLGLVPDKRGRARVFSALQVLS